MYFYMCVINQFAGVKKNIETVHGDVYPTAQQMLIHQGKVLKDPTTLEENKVAENSFIVILLSKTKAPSGEASTAATAPRHLRQVPHPLHQHPLSPRHLSHSNHGKTLHLFLFIIFTNSNYVPTKQPWSLCAGPSPRLSSAWANLESGHTHYQTGVQF
ncbi:hypothetical protein L2E82_05147 [Cichorium intybus]|uniref:Uncharacterized protein n=1 Tax=Cichorium intybus TaxID=13427 RepID=A0ACB9H676_CICIN|nr:hypothetical protein L2E82_05147 [Cichorium intybus]